LLWKRRSWPRLSTAPPIWREGSDPCAHETLSCCVFPSEHWRRIRTGNPLERIMREIRRRTRRRRGVPGRQVMSQPRRGQVEAYRRDHMVGEALFEHGVLAEGENQRRHDRLSPSRGARQSK
jgi:hypothetical protein